MNVITNSCIGAYIYVQKKLKYNNPFMWNAIEFEDFVSLVENYDVLNYENVKFDLETYKTSYWGKMGYKSVMCTIDNKVTLHYIFTEGCDAQRANNIFSNNILSYTKDKFISRMHRNETKEPPIFLYIMNTTDVNSSIYVEKIQRLLSIETQYKLIIVIHKSKYNTEYEKNSNILAIDDDMMGTDGEALQKITEQIIKYID